MNSKNKKNFFLCGLTGWCMEILFTSFGSIGGNNLKLMGQTSVWMFPIYGMAFLIEPVYRKIQHWPLIGRGCLYSLGIMSGEYLSGSLLKRHNVCPWDYSGARFNINGIIRLDYLPLWLVAGLVFERLLCGQGTPAAKAALSVAQKTPEAP